MRTPTKVLSLVLLFAAGCATYEQELQRAEDHYGHDEHEKSLATLRALESEWPSLSDRDRARYAYLRGMTDYRIGYKNDARHWLAIAAQIDKDHPGALVANERSQLDEKLAELNAVVWAGDVIPTEQAPGAHPPKKIETTKPAGDDDAPPPAKKKDKDEEKDEKSDDDSPKPKKKPK